ncbi:hypothetical protein HPB52_022409 [Rhipicephalus sanguineus]|uniref:Uncharacterized protein n=1 Tax=Rhipicephalus sanguineus TaxID=34632 RepID=A0A9D4Q3I1_RHISA|nr:hypothetical protein HPB52_022409 [Rhipicephalus sanguineus]
MRRYKAIEAPDKGVQTVLDARERRVCSGGRWWCENDGVATVSLSAEKSHQACMSEEHVKTLATIGSQDTAVRFMYACDPDRSQYVTMWGPMHRYNYFLWLSDGTRKTGPDANMMEKSFMYSILGRDASEEVETCVKRSRKITRWKLLVQFCYIAKTMFTVSHGVESTSRKTAELRLKVDERATAAQIYDYMGRSLHHLLELYVSL